MTHSERLWANIAANKLDTFQYRVYADWLEEYGVTSEFIRSDYDNIEHDNAVYHLRKIADLIETSFRWVHRSRKLPWLVVIDKDTNTLYAVWDNQLVICEKWHIYNGDDTTAWEFALQCEQEGVWKRV